MYGGHFRCWLGILALALLALALSGALGQQIHRNDLGGAQVYLLRGTANARFKEVAHSVSTEYAHAGSSSEFLNLEIEACTQAKPFAWYVYPVPHAPVGEDLRASIWVKANNPGIRLCARLVLPRMRSQEPGHEDQALTTIVEGETYNNTDSWQRLELSHVSLLLRENQQLLRARLARDIDLTDAYVDQLLLNLYTGPGSLQAWFNRVDIGPVLDDRVIPKASGHSQIPRNRPMLDGLIELQRDQLIVGDKRYFFRAIRHTDTPLDIWKRVGFNTLILESGISNSQVDEALRQAALPPSGPFRQELYLVPTVDEIDLDIPIMGQSSKQQSVGLNRLSHNERVLFCYLGGGRTVEGLNRIVQSAQFIREPDPQRLVAVDAWDGLWPYSRSIDMLGIHRWPLLSSLELTKYRDLLNQRRYLARPGAFTWTWVQTHWPDSFTQLIYDRPADSLSGETIGPQPEQIRLLTYLGLCCGFRGIGFWSDRFLMDTHQGQDRLLEVALLNLEMQMLEPALLSQIKSPFWIDTSQPEIKAAVLYTDKGMLVIPIWLGGGAQYVPGQSVKVSLTLTVPQPPLTSEPWEIRPGIVRALRPTRVPGGVQITIPEFDLCTTIVFTGDNGKDGLLVWWQDQCRQTAPTAAEWTIRLARAELEKIRPVEDQLLKLAPELRGSSGLLDDAERRIQLAQSLYDGKDFCTAYLEAQRALRPLRLLMRLRFDQALDKMQPPPEKPKPLSAEAKKLPPRPAAAKPPAPPETPHLRIAAASPYAVSYWTLPKHWPFWNSIKESKLGSNALPNGNFEGVPDSHWTKKEESLDDVIMQARYSTQTPKEGAQCLELNISPKPNAAKADQPPKIPGALDRTFLGVRSPTVHFAPGTIIKISGWVKIPRTILASADGAMAYDNIGGETLSLRLTDVTDWKQFELYRRVPASGEVFVVLAMTGLGTVQFDDIRIEPLVPKSETAKQP